MEASKAPCCLSPLGTSGGSEDLERSDLATESTGQSKDMVPTCAQRGGFDEENLGTSDVSIFRGLGQLHQYGVGCTEATGQKKRRLDRGSHGHPQS